MNDPYTMEAKLCGDDGIVRRGPMHHGTDYPCTGHAHFAGEHIRCTNPIHSEAREPRTVTNYGGLPTAPARDIGTDQGAVKPDVPSFRLPWRRTRNI